VTQIRSENRGIQLRAAQTLTKATTELQPKIIPLLLPLLKSERVHLLHARPGRAQA